MSALLLPRGLLRMKEASENAIFSVRSCPRRASARPFSRSRRSDAYGGHAHGLVVVLQGSLSMNAIAAGVPSWASACTDASRTAASLWPMVSPSPGTLCVSCRRPQSATTAASASDSGERRRTEHLGRMRLREPVGHLLKDFSQRRRGERRDPGEDQLQCRRPELTAAPPPTVASPARAGASSSDGTSWLTMAGSLSSADEPVEARRCAGARPGRAWSSKRHS